MSEQANRVDHAELPEALVLRFDSGTIGKLERTPTGGIRVPARVTRAGVLVYQRADGTTIREYRSPDEVFRADSLASLADCAVTVAHPECGSVTPDTFRRDAVGHVREGGRRDATFVGATLVINDGDAIARIDSGELRELSCGYRCTVDPTPGVTPGGERYDAIQRGIAYNHVALLPRGGGRAGRDVALRLDGAAVAVDEPPPTDNPAPHASAKTRTDAMKERIDGVDYTVGTPEWQQAHARHMARVDAESLEVKIKLDAAEKALAVTTGELEGSKAALAAAVKDLTEAKDQTKLDARAAVRSALVEKARTVLGTSAKFEGKTDDAIRREVLTKLDGAACVEGQSADVVDGMFRGRMSAVATTQIAGPRLDAANSTLTVPTLPVDLDAYRVRPGDY